MVRPAKPICDVKLGADFWEKLNPKKQPEWISCRQLAEDTSRLIGKLPPDISAIVGVPRSGMIPASIMATLLHLPLWEFSSGQLRQLHRGSRGHKQSSGRMLVIDDSVYSGAAMRRVRTALSHRDDFAFAAVYVKPSPSMAVDYYARLLGHECHLFEWNFFNNPWIIDAGIALDFDGILCHDPLIPDADEGPGLENYRQWMMAALPRWLVRARPVRLIVTARLERFRAETEAWLQRFGVSYDELVMCPAAKASQRGDIAAFKAENYARTATAFFVESDARQAAEIHRLTGKQVICPDISRVWR